MQSSRRQPRPSKCFTLALAISTSRLIDEAILSVSRVICDRMLINAGVQRSAARIRRTKEGQLPENV